MIMTIGDIIVNIIIVSGITAFIMWVFFAARKKNEKQMTDLEALAFHIDIRKLHAADLLGLKEHIRNNAKSEVHIVSCCLEACVVGMDKLLYHIQNTSSFGRLTPEVTAVLMRRVVIANPGLSLDSLYRYMGEKQIQTRSHRVDECDSDRVQDIWEE